MKLWEQKIKALNFLVYLLTQSHFPLDHVFLIASQAVFSFPSLVCGFLFFLLSRTVFYLSALAISAPFLLLFNFYFLISSLFTLSSLRHLHSLPSAPSSAILVQPTCISLVIPLLPLFVPFQLLFCSPISSLLAAW